MPQSLSPQLLSIGTALPPHKITQDEVMAVLGRARGKALPLRMEQILRNSGIAERYLAMPTDYYLGPRSWAERSVLYADAAAALFKAATSDALDAARLAPADIGQIVLVSTTGTMTPSLPSRMLEQMGFAREVRTVPVFGYGCAGGVVGLSLATDLFRASPEKAVLLVCLELCSMAYDHVQMEKKDLVATALFADGCAATVIGAEPTANGAPKLAAFAQYVWPDSIDMMGWDIGETGFDLVLARDIPAFVTRDFAPVADAFLASQKLTKADLAEPACHPGGGRVVDALADYFGDDLAATRRVLRDYGNMSSPTVLFVLKELLDAGRLAGPTLLTALGPGFTGALGLVRP
jgi:alkylresorcinol/alkylpyrone synthase